MNRTAINGALLGVGGTDNRSFISSSVYAIASSISDITRSAMLEASVVAEAAASSVASGILQFVSSVTASATTLSDYLTVGVQQFYSAISATATAISSPIAWYSFGANVIARASSLSAIAKVVGQFFTSSVIAKAAVSSNLVMRSMLSSIATARSISTSLMARGAKVASSVFAIATGSSKIQEATAASDDRLMILPEEIRTMELPE